MSLAIANVPDSPDEYANMNWSGIQGGFASGVTDAVAGVLGSTVLFQPDEVTGLAAVSDLSGNGSPELVALGVRPDGRPRVQIRDSATDAVVKNLLFVNVGFDPLDMVVMSDLGGDGGDDIAVLADNLYTGKITVQVRDGASGSLVSNVAFLSLAWRAHQLLSVSDLDNRPGDELGVLATDADGRIAVMVRDASTGDFIRNVRFLSTNWEPVRAVAMSDFSGNGADEIGVLARRKDNGMLIIMIRDASSNSFISNVYPLDDSHTPVTVVVLPDENSNGASELATLGVDNGTGQPVIDIRDANSGVHLRTLNVFNADWEVKDMVVLPDIGGGAPGLAVLATRKSDGLPVVQTINGETGSVISEVAIN